MTVQSDPRCPLCSLSSEGVIAELRSVTVRLQDQSAYPGYCILVLKRHAVEVFHLAPEERGALMEDIAAVSRAVSHVTGADKINLLMLGNQTPHLHCHVVPRLRTDPDFLAAPKMQTAGERVPLPSERLALLTGALKQSLEHPPGLERSREG